MIYCRPDALTNESMASHIKCHHCKQLILIKPELKFLEGANERDNALNLWLLNRKLDALCLTLNSEDIIAVVETGL
jgi:hypothetical protein